MAGSKSTTSHLKRKTQEQLDGRETKHLRTLSNSRETNITFRLLDLPAELRNLVYEKVAEEQVAYLVRRNLQDRPGLLSVNRQLRNEYIPIMLLYPSKIQANVMNFDFRDVHACINRLCNAEMNTVSITKPRSRELHIQLQIRKDASWDSYWLWRWLYRVRPTNEKRMMLHVSYSLVPYYGDYVSEYFLPPSSLPGYPYVPGWARMLDNHLRSAKDVKAIEEGTKIRASFDGLF